ncbi:MAG: prenyltransferase/squalene oxidase repeat-containing protein [Candidatus Spyradenecus sp.]
MSNTLEPPPGNEPAKDELIKLFDEEERNYLQRIVDMLKGFGQPKDSIEHKKAMIELQRLGAPIAAVVGMLLAITVMCTIKITASEKPPVVETQVIEPEQAEELTKEEPPPPEEPPELEEIQEVTDVVVDIDAPPTTSAEQSPQPSPVDAVALTPSPMVMRNVYGDRSPGLRGAKIGKYGAAGTEKLVYGFLRWLKMKQGPNGMWNNDTGDTSLALLCFLAHGELPGQSDEFGDTVEKAIRGLLADQISDPSQCKPGGADNPSEFESRRKDKVGYFKGRDAHNYAHLVAIYALSEAYAMTRIPAVKEAVERAIPHVIEGQNADGGWYYNMYAKCPTTDTSYTSWAVQALKAAKLSGNHDPKIIAALKKSARGIKTCANPNGTFGYLNTAKNRYLGLTAPCALILQMLDEADTDLCKKAVAYMDTWEPTFKQNFKAASSSATQMVGTSPQYYGYYLSQVRFNLGDNAAAWKRWSEQQKRVYSAAAINIPADKSGYKDHNGKAQYITYWPRKNTKNKFGGEGAPIEDKARLMQQQGTANGKRNGIPVDDLINTDTATYEWHNSPVAANCFTALQLMVYYRNSPLAKGALTKIEAEAELKVEDKGAGAVTLEGLDDDF